VPDNRLVVRAHQRGQAGAGARPERVHSGLSLDHRREARYPGTRKAVVPHDPEPTPGPGGPIMPQQWFWQPLTTEELLANAEPLNLEGPHAPDDLTDQEWDALHHRDR
jgi:hypothetical protein